MIALAPWNGTPAKGYELETFADAFARYTPSSRSVTPLQANKINEIDEKQPVTPALDVTVQNRANALKSLDCNGETLQKPKIGSEGEHQTAAPSNPVKLEVRI